jgi:hypothetical protein
MTPADYETLVADLIRELRSVHPDLASADVRSGSRKRVRGESGYSHQIDVSLLTEKTMVIIECKYYDRKIGLEAVLVLVGRLADIRPTVQSHEIIASLVTTHPPSRNAQKVADYFGIHLQRVSTPSEYAIGLRDRMNIGVVDSGHVKDETVEVIRR